MVTRLKFFKNFILLLFKIYVALIYPFKMKANVRLFRNLNSLSRAHSTRYFCRGGVCKWKQGNKAPHKASSTLLQEHEIWEVWKQLLFLIEDCSLHSDMKRYVFFVNIENFILGTAPIVLPNWNKQHAPASVYLSQKKGGNYEVSLKLVLSVCSQIYLLACNVLLRWLLAIRQTGTCSKH